MVNNTNTKIILKLPLVTLPDVPHNDIVYSKKTYDDMINSEYYQGLKKNDMLYITTGAENDRKGFDMGSLISVDFKDVIGRVVNLYDDSVDVEIYDDSVKNIIRQHNGSEFKIGMKCLTRMSHYDSANDPYITIYDMKFLHYVLFMDGKSIHNTIKGFIK